MIDIAIKLFSNKLKIETIILIVKKGKGIIMALIILGHPNIEQSVANKTIIENVQTNMPDIEIRNIHQLYPNYQINVQEEQAALLRHNLIVLQYPLYCLNMPAILKIWFEQVLTYQFAYGSKGDKKLKNKKLLPSLTIGANQEVYQQDGHNLVDDFLQPVKISTIYMQMQYLSPIFLYGVSPEIESHTKIKALAVKHSQRLQEIIKQHS